MIYYDFHIHSCLSPCGDQDMTPNNIVNMAVLLGLNAISVSDHNAVGNVKAAMEVAKEAGIIVIPGMEVETEEEVHILTLYPNLEAAETAASEVHKKLPPIKNRPEIFGQQVFMDKEDNITGYEDKLLISPCAMSMNYLFDVVKSVGGVYIPAHVDRHSYSVLTNLGFIPDDIDIKNIEISRMTEDVNSFLSAREELKKYNIYRNSDAHYLQDMREAEAFLNISDISELFGG